MSRDALVVVDDFAPSGRRQDSELEGVAERLFRGVGNGQGRSRMESRGRLAAHKPPRGLVLATGEVVPSGHSIRGRMLIVGVAPGDLNVDALSECQKAASGGVFAESTAAFLRWIARQYEGVQARFRDRVVELRLHHRGASHARRRDHFEMRGD